jgi:hypothetical protein
VSTHASKHSLDDAAVGRVCILLLRLLRQGERARVVAHRTSRRQETGRPAKWLRLKARNSSQRSTGTPVAVPHEASEQAGAARDVLCVLLPHVQRLLSTDSESALSSITAAHLVQALAKSGMMGVDPHNQLLQRLLASTVPQLPGMPDDCLVKLVWGVGKLGLQPPRDWLQASSNVWIEFSND